MRRRKKKMADALRAHVTRRNAATPQSEPAREDQVKNSAGGFTFAVGDDVRLHRFLTLGTQGGTYYTGERELTRDNADIVVKLATASDERLIHQAVNVSLAGRAPSNDPALFAIAAAAGLGSTEYRAKALDVLPQVARTGHHILTFAAYAEMFRGWGPQLVKGVNRWYTGRDVDGLAYQLLKYKQREDWSQRDLLRLAGRKGGPSFSASTRVSPEHERLFAYIMKGAAAHATRNVREWEFVIRTSHGQLSWEMLPSEALAEPEVWRALIESGSLPQGALIRNLPRLTTLGLLQQGDSWTRDIAERIADGERLTRARVHPVQVLLAAKTYAGGRSLRGKGTWTPVSVITDALDAAFYAAFPAVEPSGKRVMVALDVSGSMGNPAGGLPVTCREVTAAMSLVVLKTEPLASVWGFTSGLQGYRGTYRSGGNPISPLDISSRRRLDDVTRYIAGLDFGGTDCALPMVHALKSRMEVDTFQVWTDNETWAGSVHPHQALEQYRRATGIAARLQVVAITPTEFTIADPLDPGSLDVSGFDAAVPVLLANHARGDI
jgi:60 kDa SS-A/Ro ribonucleoprotein